MKTTAQIKMFDKVTSGITFSSSGETTIYMVWNKEGIPALNDIHLELTHYMDTRKINVSLI